MSWRIHRRLSLSKDRRDCRPEATADATDATDLAVAPKIAAWDM